MAPKTDLLSLPYKKRIKAEQRMIAMHREGISNREIARELGLYVYAVNHWLELYRQANKNAQGAINGRKGGNLPGSRVLTDEQRARMRSDLFKCRPNQINPEWLLWDRYSIVSWLSQRLGVDAFGSLGIHPLLERFEIRTPDELRMSYHDQLWDSRDSYLAILRKARPSGIPIVLVTLTETKGWKMISSLSHNNRFRFLLYQHRHTPSAFQWKRFLSDLYRTHCPHGGQLNVIIKNKLPIFESSAIIGWLSELSNYLLVYIKDKDNITKLDLRFNTYWNTTAFLLERLSDASMNKPKIVLP